VRQTGAPELEVVAMSNWEGTLKTKDIYLRYLRKTDAPRMSAAVEESRTELEKHLVAPDNANRISEAEQIERARTMRKKGLAHVFGIFAIPEGEFVGCISLHGIQEKNRSAEIGCWVRTSCSGKGLATAAAALIVLFGFKELRLHRLVLRAASDNPASWRIADKLGFVYDGIQRHEQLMPRGYIDLKCYSMLETEFRKLRSTIRRSATGKKD